jgi:hypothetical protein
MLQAEIQRCVAKHRTLDQNLDGELAADELDPIKRVVKDVDRNLDEKLDFSELRSACASGVLTDRGNTGMGVPRQNPSSSSNSRAHHQKR